MDKIKRIFKVCEGEKAKKEGVPAFVLADSFKIEHKGKYIYISEFLDNDGYREFKIFVSKYEDYTDDTSIKFLPAFKITRKDYEYILGDEAYCTIEQILGEE